MQVLIRDVKTGLYLTLTGWTADIDAARDFERGADALSFAMRNALEGIEIIDAFPEAEFNFSTGILDFSRKHPSRRTI